MQEEASHIDRRLARQALLLWLAFILVNGAINATIPFALGADVRPWLASAGHAVLYGVVVYGAFFLVAPLVLVKGWPTVRQSGFLIPLILAVVGAGLWSVLRGSGVVIILALGYLHWRYDLSQLGVRSSGWRGDAAVFLIIATLYSVPRLFRPFDGGIDVQAGFQAGLQRLLANPATSAEYLFYFGFLATRLSNRAGLALTPIAIGLMYMAHEMTNPEYWYEGMQFGLVFAGVAIASALYLRRRSLLPIWLGDGVSRFVQALLP